MLFLLFESCIRKNTNQEDDIYNFGFEKEISFEKGNNNWQISGCPSKIESETHIAKFGNCSAKVNVFSSPYSEGQSLRIFQSIYLPLKANKINLSIWLKSEGFCNVSVKVSLLNANEDTVSCKLIRFNTISEWKNYDMSIRGNSARILFVEIILDKNSKVWLDQVAIKVDGESFYKYLAQVDYHRNFKDVIIQNNATKMNLSDTIKKGLLANFQGKKIIGIGESVHGIHEMAILRNQLIKGLVKEENCKLIVFEAPDYFIELLNKYVQGLVDVKDIFDANDIDKTQYYIYSEEMFQLVKWLKEYNMSTKEKVIIAGMDVSPNWKMQLTDILLKYCKYPLIKNMLTLLQNNDNEKLYEVIADNQTQLIRILGDKTYSYLLTLLRKSDRFDNVYRSNFNARGRDSIMAVNIKELITNYTNGNEKTIICGHLAHLNKLNQSTSLTPSVGKWLNKFYGDNYFVIAQLVGNGSYRDFQLNPNTKNIHLLQAPIEGSIEFICSKVPYDFFYKSVSTSSEIENQFMAFRLIGGIPQLKQFYSGNMQRRMDAIIFIQQGSPLYYFQNKLKLYYDNKQKMK